MDTPPRIRTFENTVTLTVRIRTSHYENQVLPRNYGSKIYVKLQKWLSDIKKWDVVFTPQSHSPDTKYLTTILDNVRIQSAEALPHTAFYIHVDNTQFLQFINNDKFYTDNLPK